MGFPWGRVAELGLGIGSKFVPGLSAGVAVVEVFTTRKKAADPTFVPQNTEREDQAVMIALGVLKVTEGIKGEDLLNDAAVMEAVRKAIRLEVAAKNAKAALEAAREELSGLLSSLKAIRVEDTDA